MLLRELRWIKIKSEMCKMCEIYKKFVVFSLHSRIMSNFLIFSVLLVNNNVNHISRTAFAIMCETSLHPTSYLKLLLKNLITFKEKTSIPGIFVTL